MSCRPVQATVINQWHTLTMPKSHPDWMLDVAQTGESINFVLRPTCLHASEGAQCIRWQHSIKSCSKLGLMESGIFYQVVCDLLIVIGRLIRLRHRGLFWKSIIGCQSVTDLQTFSWSNTLSLRTVGPMPITKCRHNIRLYNFVWKCTQGSDSCYSQTTNVRPMVRKSSSISRQKIRIEESTSSTVSLHIRLD